MDMQSRNEFSKSIGTAFSSIFFLYLVSGLSCYVTLGSSINDNFVETLMNLDVLNTTMSSDTIMVYQGLTYTALVSYGIHFIFAYVLLFNGATLELEEWLDIPKCELSIYLQEVA